ncbi:phage tail tape measure protein [Cytobacillus solani]|uniref:phage tail tape measure protein n=1 Tax=Cytobacillus solani TaxID=1637975 RepID=UPI0020794148|nr:phage tail tape measure protein [Cytobacillus solani]USK56578.1 phage tail tape measure protein [Cytobacillus solani]
MAEVGALRINLSLNSVDFSQGMQTVNRQLTALNSEFRAITSGAGRFDTSLESLRSQSDVLTRTMTLHRTRVEELRRQYEQSAQATGQNSTETLQLATAYNRAVAQMNRTEQQLRGINTQIQQQSNGFNQLQNEVNQSVDRITRELRVLDTSFAAATAGIEDFGSSTTDLQQRETHLTQSFNLQRQRVDELNRLYQESARTKGADAQETQELQIRLNRATQEMRETEAQLNQTTNQIQQQTNAWNRLQQGMTNTGNRLQHVGGQMQSIGSEITQSFGAAFLAIGAGLGLSAKKAMDFEQQMSSVYSVMAPDEVRAFGIELEKLAVQLGSDTKYSALEAAQGIEELIKAGVQTTDIINGGLEGALSLATAGELELADAAEIASTALNAFKADNLSVMRAADLLAGAANASATSVGELKFGLSAVSAVASGVGMTFEDTTTALASFAQNGLKGSDAGTSLKTMLLRLSPTTKEASEAFDQLGLSAYNNAAGYQYLISKGITPASRHVQDLQAGLVELTKQELGSAASKADLKKRLEENTKASGLMSSAFYDEAGSLKSLSEIAELLKTKMAHLNDEQRQNYFNTMFGTDAIRAANILYKEGAQGITSMATAMNKIKSADVAAQKLDNVKGRIEELSGAIETAAISLGNALLPTIDKVVAFLQKMTDKFNSLSPGMQKLIVNSALVAAGITGVITAIGVALAVVGAAVTGIGAITTGLGSLAGVFGVTGGAAGLFGAAFTALTGPIGLAVAAIAGLTVGGIALYNHLKKDSIPEVERFGEGVSKATKEALGSFFELSDGASLKLKELSLTQQKVTVEMKNELVATYEKMNDEILAKMDERHAKQMEKTQNFFALSNALTQEEETKILRAQEMRNNSEVAGQEFKEQRIKEILEKAAAERRTLTENEQKEINSIQQTMNENAVKYLAANELEAKIIMERMKQTAGDLSARQAAEVVANSNKQKEEAVKAANEQYNQTLAEIIRMRDETGDITAEQANRMIEEATRQRDITVMRAEETHNKVVGAAKKQADEHINHVNWETGEILSKWEVFKNNVGTTMDLTAKLTKKYWTMMTDEATRKANEMKDNAIQKYEELKAKAGQKFDEIKEKIMTPIKEAKEKVSDFIDDIKGFFSNLKLKLPKIEVPKLPHFKLSGEFSLKPPSVPKVSVDWYAKGAVFTKPTIFNTPYGMKGFGEAGPEAALPLTDSVLGTIGAMIAKTMPETTNNQPYSFILNPAPIILDGVEIGKVDFDLIEDRLGSRTNHRMVINGVRRR